jgi:hypothetical protein
MTNVYFPETLVSQVMEVITTLGNMVFMSLDGNRFGFQRINDKIKDG